MLKDITLGQFFPGHSLLHRLDPRVKLVLTAAYIVALFMAHGVFTYGVMVLWLAAAVRLSRLRVRVLVKGIRPLVLIITLTALLNIFYTDGVVLFSFWILRVTLEGLVIAGRMVLRIVMLIMGTFLLTYTTSPIRLTDALECLLGPLKKLRAPIHELATMMTIALRFIPTLLEETDKIMNAQRARGADFDSGHVVRRARALVPLLVPLFVSAFRRAEDLAMAMECRCYHGGEGRTRMYPLRMTPLDGCVLTAMLAVSVGVGVASRFGY
ncbi:MAG: energy-coupling factor transporter transmembrane protein EcfT [Oscillospiraceae bacterium]|jgi:energy-coupling factor transport system permease protein|nr:energy-coupling factor transporter transmembrane protein EcfT [Oscillospiraceae bacterium]